ncbi:reverse transcriptase N-terminal domain-containing protein [Lyngbya sp. PCC 8106]|uniref:reverse transcriptase N-terminal domain-containing protein n=1 Tax=Lyngbya sp. (strain PCC 8106) TaxID=313612 RepID=UPI0002E4D15B
MTGKTQKNEFSSYTHRIYKASRRDDVLTVRRLQKTLIKSWTAKCLAVRRVTQENTGKKTLLSGWGEISIPSSTDETCQ